MRPWFLLGILLSLIFVWECRNMLQRKSLWIMVRNFLPLHLTMYLALILQDCFDALKSKQCPCDILCFGKTCRKPAGNCETSLF